MITIDYFEYLVLIDTSWCDSTILRSSILQKTIDVWYDKLNADQRKGVYVYLKRKECDQNIHDQILARYNPDNQFKVTVNYKGDVSTIDCYSFEGHFYKNRTSFVADEYIVSTVPC
jgi:hypothetical protein